MNRVNTVRPDEFSPEADKPRVVTEARINTPSIVILLGSTSALSALELMRHMLTLSVDDRRRVALVYIDTDSAPPDLVEFRHNYNGVFQEFPLRIAVPVGISYSKLEPQELSDPGAKADKGLELHTFIKGKEPQYFVSGAGGIRNNGHVAACFHHQDIYNTLDSALATVTRIDNMASGRRAKGVHVNIVAFLGGGTGSGILPDIAVMIRDLLTHYHYEQRINLFCMLPEPVREASQTDLSWRKSNATACLMELLAYSSAARSRGGRYNKYMRDKIYRLTDNAIANEVYLIGHSSMGDVKGTARIVGLDLFQRITDASSVGELEYSKAVDRLALAKSDEKDLPTMFGTSCPLEVSFPAYDTADAFARISAARLLPLLASYQPQTLSANDADKSDWTRKWNNVARIDANVSDPRVIRPGTFNFEEFVEADQSRLDILWGKLERLEQETERKIAAVMAVKRNEELQNIKAVPPVVAGNALVGVGSNVGARAATNMGSLQNTRIQHLQRLQQEYATILESLETKGTPPVPARPLDSEADLVQPTNWFLRLRSFGRDYTSDVFVQYNARLEAHALATRHRLLEDLLRYLLHSTTDALSSSMSWIEEAQVDTHQHELEVAGMTSAAYQGRLNYPHPHQRHIFDLRTLRGDGRNIAVERLYVWATGGNQALTQGTPIDYGSYISRCVEYLTRNMKDANAVGQSQDAQIESYSAGRLADRVVDFFRDYYQERFQDTNLFELLDKAAPPSPKGQPRNKQLSDFIMEHLQYVRNLLGSMIAFEAELWSRGSVTLDTSIYLGMHLRDESQQRSILDMAISNLGPLTEQGQSPRIETAIDPHRLQLVYGQHGISLNTVRDFYLDQNSSMAAYLYHQKQWDDDGGSNIYGNMPVHSCSEVQWLVRDRKAMGYQPPEPLYERVIRKPN